MRRILGFAVAAAAMLALPACSKQLDERAESSDSAGGPNISPSAAPGVAWTFAYDFRLDDEAISAAQEASAAQCESMGLDKCRITGLDYRVDSDRNTTGSLSVKLAPELARKFGKDATAIVGKAGGELARLDFNGEDTQPAMSVATANASDAAQRIAQTEARLAQPGLGDRERAELQATLQELKVQQASARMAQSEVQTSLAATPMTLNYYGRGTIAGFRTNPVMEAWRTLVASVVTMVGMVLQFAAVILPWALLVALIVMAFRTRPGRRFRRSLGYTEEPVAEPEPAAKD